MCNHELIFMAERYEGTIEQLLNEELDYTPFYDITDLKNQCDLIMEPYGFIHDCGFHIYVVKHNQARKGHGWETAERDFCDEIRRCERAWEIARDFSYRGTGD
jgi:hypothetical protein